MIGKAVYAGTFDPLTLGHLDLVERAAHQVDTLIVAVSISTSKQTVFTVEERLEMATEAVQPVANAVVMPFKGLLVNFARSQKSTVLIRGLRAYSDFEYEFQMALTNRRLAPDIETLFLMPKDSYSYLSSTLVREVAVNGGDTSEMVPPAVFRRVAERWPLS